jgi:hypothetical protein
MPISSAALLAAIQSDPALAAWAAGGDDTSIANALNTVQSGITLPRTAVPRGEIATMVLMHNAYPALRDTAAGSGPFATLAWFALGFLADSGSTLNFADPSTPPFVAALDAVKPGLGTAIAAIGQRPASRAEQLGGDGYRVTHTDVSAALLPTREAL